ncbi:MAG: hypothetical protein JWM27_2524 [Gemmatimonadetes bacterium]|nr:hypothetical protein [Gemmatimonadota bacterium]
MSLATTLRDRLGLFARLLRLPVPPPEPPVALGVVDGRLAPCPRWPNCVSSFATDRLHGMPPLPGRGGRDATMARLRTILGAEPGAHVVEDRGDYLRAELTTALWRFVDDVELLWDEDAGVVHFRSASRIGRADLGTNRRRMERIVARLAEAAGT